MNPVLTCLAALSMALLLLPGCRKKQPVAEPAARPAAPGAGATASSAPRTTGGGASAASADQSEEGARDPALDGVPAELLASDRAYEAWFKKHGLDLRDDTMLDADTDGDGFSNRDEFLADTDPRDPNSRPGIHTTMRLKEYREVTLPLLLESVDGDRARLKRMDGEGASETVRAGQTLRNTNYRVERVSSRPDFDKDGNPIERAVVQLTDTGTAEKVTLIKNMPAVSADSYAVLTSANGETTQKVKQGETFSWPGEEGTEYKVIDLRADQAVVQDVATSKMWTIPRQ